MVAPAHQHIFNSLYKMRTHPVDTSIASSKQIRSSASKLSVPSTSKVLSHHHEQKISLYDSRWSSTKPSCSSWCTAQRCRTTVHTSLHTSTFRISSANIHGSPSWRATSTSGVLLASNTSTCARTYICTTTSLSALRWRASSLRRLSSNTTSRKPGSYPWSRTARSRCSRRHGRHSSTRCSCPRRNTRLSQPELRVYL